MTLIVEGWKNDLGVDVALNTPETAVEVQQRSQFNYDIVWYFPTMRVGIHPAELASQFTTDTPENWARYSNKDVDDLFSQLAGTLDKNKIGTLAKQVETQLWTDMPCVPLLYPVDVTITKPRVRGIAAQPWLTNEDYSTVWVTE